ncbi:MAG: glycosyltransferase family 2 protein [Syntrophobacterales bacterium]|nr:glycosyltransferase family 2 protein [Syntrophobacterales bacterium]
MDRPPCPAALSVVVPVYNSEASLRELVTRLGPVLAGTGAPFELILVNDGSRDGSGRVIEELTSRHEWVRGIHLVRNFGQHNALLCGIRDARHDVVVTMDDDLQNPPEEIPKLLEKLGEGVDVVYGTPETKQHGIFRNLASRITRVALQGSMEAETARHASAFRAFRTCLRDAFASYGSPFVSIDVLLTWGTDRFAAVRVDHRPRRAGRSNYTLRKLVVHAFNMMTGFSTLPLQFASLTGFVFTLFGIAVLAYVLGRYALEGGSVPGFPFLASVIAIFAGAQLFALGIIGEYLARMHFRMMEKPTYVSRREQQEHCKEKRWDVTLNQGFSARSMRKRS